MQFQVNKSLDIASIRQFRNFPTVSPPPPGIQSPLFCPLLAKAKYYHPFPFFLFRYILSEISGGGRETEFFSSTVAAISHTREKERERPDGRKKEERERRFTAIAPLPTCGVAAGRSKKGQLLLLFLLFCSIVGRVCAYTFVPWELLPVDSLATIKFDVALSLFLFLARAPISPHILTSHRSYYFFPLSFIFSTRCRPG